MAKRAEAGTGTELLETQSEEIRQQAEENRKDQSAAIQGRLAPGTDVAGFTVKDFFAFGGEAELYFCERGGTRYVLKYDNNNIMERDEELLGKLKSMHHPNILPLIAYGKFKSYPYTILEFAQGGTLTDKTEGSYKYLPLSEEKAVEAVSDIIEGYKTIHAKGIIHRDIKPENLFYKNEKDGIGSGVLLGDFGISSLFQADEGMTSHYTQHTFHTLGYEAPEMYVVSRDEEGKNTQRISPAIDYYALGITLWVLLTGKEPFLDEKSGKYLPAADVRRNATYSETPDILIARSPDLSEKMKKLIRGLLVVRRDERWNYEKIKDHLAGKDVKVFYEEQKDLPPIEIAGTECKSFQDICRALVANPKEGRELIFSKGRELTKYIFGLNEYRNDSQEIGDKIADMADAYSAKAEEERQKEKDPEKQKEIVESTYAEGLFAVAYSLSPKEPFILGRYKEKDEDGKEQEKVAEVRSMTEILGYLETDPNLIIPVLRDRALGFYAYLEVQKNSYGDIGGKIWDVVENTRSNLKLVPRLQIAFNDNVIRPFEDKVKENELRELRTIEQLETLPDHLKERFIIFIEMKRDDVTAWVENMSGRDLDIWLNKYKTQKDKLKTWGMWRSFRLFLDGKDVQVHKTFSSDEGGKKRWGLKNNLQEVILAPVWDFALANSPPNRFIVKKNEKWGLIDGSGTEIIPFTRDLDLITIFDEEQGLYQCKDGNNVWTIIDEKGNILWTGKEALRIAAAPGKPFDVIYDSAHYYNNKTFEALNQEGVAFEIAGSEKGNYIWQIKDSGCTVCSGNGEPLKGENGEPLKVPPYTAFRTGTNAIGVMVERDGSWGVASPDGSKEYIPCSHTDIKGGGGPYYALFMPGKTGGILCELVKAPSGGYKKEDRYWLKFEESGAVDILPSGGGNAKASFDSVAHLGLEYTDTESFAPAGKLACLGGGELLWFDLAKDETSKRNVVLTGEVRPILARCNGAELYTILQFLKTQEAYGSMNRIIDTAAEIDIRTNTGWSTEKSDGHWLQILGLIDQKHTDELSRQYDYYVSMMGAEAIKTRKYNDAYKYYSSAIALNPNNAGYHAGCGTAYFYLGDFTNSAEFYSKAAGFTTIKVLSVQYTAARGSAFFSAGKFNEAMASFTQAITEFGPSASAEFYIARAACFQQLSMGDKSRADIEAASKAPKNSGEKIRGIPLPTARASSVNIAQVVQSRDVNTVLQALDTLKAEGSITSMNALIDASYQQFKTLKYDDDAVKILKKINPQSAQGLSQPPWWYLNQIGLYFFTRSKFSEALPYFLDASTQNPREPNILYNGGITCYRMGNYSKAAEQFHKAAALGNAKATEELNRMRREKRI